MFENEKKICKYPMYSLAYFRYFCISLAFLLIPWFLAGCSFVEAYMNPNFTPQGRPIKR